MGLSLWDLGSRYAADQQATAACKSGSDTFGQASLSKKLLHPVETVRNPHGEEAPSRLEGVTHGATCLVKLLVEVSLLLGVELQ